MMDGVRWLEAQNRRHQLFHPAPSLRLLPQADGMADAFFAWADTGARGMSWTMHVHCLNWLKTQPAWQAYVTDSLIRELLTASATRWALDGLAHVQAKGMMLVSSHWPSFAVGVWKSTRADQGATLVTLRLPQTAALPGDAFHVTDQPGVWGELHWKMISPEG